jgi:hypothetical protein
MEITTPLTANRTWDWLRCLRLERCGPPSPYSPDLAKPNDFHLFGTLNKVSAKDADVKQAVTPWLQTTGTDFYAGI